MKRQSLIISLMLLTPGVASAQELHENVSVEGTYRPDIIKAERFNTFPEHRSISVPATPLDFDTRPSVAAFTPEARALDIMGWNVARPRISRGYLDLSLGSWLNSSLSAGYAVLDSGLTRLDVSLQHNSTSLWRPYGDEYPESSRRYRYDESLAARFCHSFTDAGLLEAQAQYRLGLFNYFSYLPRRGNVPEATAAPEAPTQTLNDIAARVAFSSVDKSSGSWNAALRVRHFALRSLYMPLQEGLAVYKGERETLIGADGGYSLFWNSGSRIGIDAALDALLYPSLTRPEGLAGVDSYAMLTLKPYYRFTRNGLIISIGADIDLAFGAPGGASGNHYGVFHIAPDVRADWQAGAIGVYLNLGGGTRLQSMAALFDRDYYCMPAIAAARPVYTPLDARLGMRFGPFSGFSAGFEAAFRTSRNIHFGGWYPTLLNYAEETASGIQTPPGNATSAFTPLYSLAADGRNLHGWCLALNADFKSAAVDLKGNVAYMPQNSRQGWCDGLDRARWQLNASVTMKPMEKLSISLDYDYRGVRTLDLPWSLDIRPGATIINGERTAETAVRLPDLCMLGADVTWRFSPRLSIGARGYNLLDSHASPLPSLPGQGVDIQGHITFRF